MNMVNTLSKGIIPLVYLYGDKLPGCSKVAAFDMDSTFDQCEIRGAEIC